MQSDFSLATYQNHPKSHEEYQYDGSDSCREQGHYASPDNGSSEEPSIYQYAYTMETVENKLTRSSMIKLKNDCVLKEPSVTRIAR
jgi:hypothetical protein